MSNYTFSNMPSVSIARTKFDRTMPHNTSFNLGELVVLGFDEVIPGSTHKIEIGSLLRMSTPIAPIMDDIQFDIYQFFVPMRLTWEHWKNFMGESPNAGVSLTTYTIPSISGFVGSAINTLADDLGLVARENVTGTTGTAISALPFRAFNLIYNRWFRNQNVEAPVPVLIGDTPNATEYSNLAPGIYVYPGSGSPVQYGTARKTAYKLPDYFTSSLPYSQKGQPVQVISNLQPVVTSSTTHAITPNVQMHAISLDGSSVTYDRLPVVDKSNGKVYAVSNSTQHAPDSAAPVFDNLYASISTTINDLRFAFQLQKALEKDALYGSRYWEVLRAHYAVTAPDASLQDPELLGHVKFDINISQVLQTTGFSSPSSTNLGTPGANSVTGHKDNLGTFSVCEHGYIFTIGVARQKRHTYSQGMNKLWLRSSRFDFYHPVFANIGAQSVKNKELFFDGGANANNLFGYQEAWAEYRFLPGYNSGYLNPIRTSSLDYWTLADKYASTPTLGTAFLKEDRSNLVRCLTTGATGPDFIGSFYIKDTCVNPMPLYSIPGFADHH